MSATSANMQTMQRQSAQQHKGVVAWFRRVTHIALLVTVGFGLLWLGYRTQQYFLSPTQFPVHSVRVDGRFQYTDRSAVQQTVAQYASAGFFGMDVDHLHADILTLPWVERAAVRRVWPDGIVLTITEHTPVARWNNDSILTRSGEVISPAQLKAEEQQYKAWQTHFKTLPFIQSEASEPAAQWQRFVEASRALHSVGIELYGIHSDSRNATTLVLRNGVSIRLGRRWFDERLQRFISVYPQYLAPQLETIAYVDMRYPNGFVTGQLAAGQE